MLRAQGQKIELAHLTLLSAIRRPLRMVCGRRNSKAVCGYLCSGVDGLGGDMSLNEIRQELLDDPEILCAIHSGDLELLPSGKIVLTAKGRQTLAILRAPSNGPVVISSERPFRIPMSLVQPA